MGTTSKCIFSFLTLVLLGVGVAALPRKANVSGRTSGTADYLRACYYPYGDPEPQVINVTLCTHIINGFAGVSNGVISLGSKQETMRYFATTNLKKDHPDLKVMLSIGGDGSGRFSAAVNSQENRTKLIKSIINALHKYNFDGLDIDWEFPVWNSGIKSDKQNFILFLRDFKFYTNYKAKSPFLLSAAVGSVQTIIDEGYDVPGMAKYVDFINLMSYDYHDYRFYTPYTGHNSPLFNRSVEDAYFAKLNTAWSATYWNQKGMPRNKILVGLPTYGHTFKLLNKTLHGFDCPATGPGIGGGTVTYPQACSFLKSGGKRVFDEESQVPYAYHGYDWIGYDDYESVTAKVNWVKSNGFGGIMTFDLNCDDWQAVCDGKTRFPLHQIMYGLLTN